MSKRSWILPAMLAVVVTTTACPDERVFDTQATLQPFGGMAGTATLERRVDPVDPGTSGSNVPTPEGSAGSTGLVETDEPDSPSNAELLALGQACERAADCLSGHCVDGFCCNAACAEVCASCAQEGNEGTCVELSADPQCAPLTCPEESECLKYDQSEINNNCSAIGQCRASVECASLPVDEGTPCGDAQEGQCDADGRCAIQGKASLGEACTVNDDCAEGACVAGPDGSNLCCDSACDGACQACGDDGRCNVTPDTDPACGDVSCPGDNICRDYTAPPSGQCRGFAQCAGSASAPCEKQLPANATPKEAAA